MGFQLIPEPPDPKKPPKKNQQGNIGSASFIDSSFSGVGTAVLIAPLNERPGTNSTGVVLENVVFSSVKAGVADNKGKTLLAGGSKRIDSWATGPIYNPKRTFSMGGDAPKYKREVSLLDTRGGVAGAPYYERPKPQYEDKPASAFVNLKSLGVEGNLA